jgi:transcriptional regulator with PAS, ATPase and Fis domain
MVDFYPLEKDRHISIRTMRSGKPIIKKTILYYSQKTSWSVPCARPFRASIKDMQKAQSIPIRAESGCGKECFDHSMHHASARGKNPFIFNDSCYFLKL